MKKKNTLLKNSMERNKVMNKKVCESDYSGDLMEAMNFDQLIVDLIRGDHPMTNTGGGGEVADQDAFEPGSTVQNSLSGLDEEDEDDEEDESEWCGTRNRWGNSKKAKVDRTRTLISERKRRGRMKEKLYALRALVPNITKMDKASIVGDAVLYVQHLQMQAKKLKSEISDLESLKHQTTRRNTTHHNYKKNSIARIVAPASKIITQVDEREFYVRLQSNKGEGVAVSLYRALESLSQFVVRSSNLTTVQDRFVLSFTLSVGDYQEDFDVPSLKMCIARALVSQGFGIRTLV